jgi:hypothetical protein
VLEFGSSCFDLVIISSLTSIHQVLDVFQRVVFKWSAVLIVSTHKESEATKVFRFDNKFSAGLHLLGEDGGEDGFSSFSVLNFSLKACLSAFISIHLDS